MSDLAVRYGRRSPRRWIWPVVAAVGVAALVAWAAWAAFQPRPVSAVLWGYKVVDDHHVRVTLDVRRSTPQAAACTIYAQAMDHSTVGERTIAITGGKPAATRVSAVITTERRAVNGVLQGCRPAE